jgi:hypothetical protein
MRGDDLAATNGGGRLFCPPSPRFRPNRRGSSYPSQRPGEFYYVQGAKDRSDDERRKAHIAWQGQRVEASLDEIERLGTFAELELVVESEGLEAAKACIVSLAEDLGLQGSERRSYLELLIEHSSSE